MTDTRILGLVDAEDLRVLAWLQAGQSLSERTEDAAHALPEPLDLHVSGTAVQLLDTPVAGWAQLTAGAALVGAGRVFDVFSTGVGHDLRPGINVAVFDLRAALGADASFAGSSSGAAMNLRTSLGAEVRYRHYLPTPAHFLRKTAYKNVVLGSRLPHLVDLTRPLEIGEVHRLDAKISLDLEAEVSAGARLAQEISVGLTHDLSTPFRMDVAATVRAALGIAFSARMAVVVARAGLEEHGSWTRVRLHRESEKRLSFGLTFGLDMHYDLGTGLAQMLEEAVDAVPTPRLVRSAQEFLSYAETPEDLPEKLTGETAEVLEDLLADGIVGALEDVVPFARRVIDAYDGLDAEIQSLWDRLLSKVDLADEEGSREVRDWLRRLAELDPQTLDLDDLLGEDVSDLAMAVEAFSGRTLEDLVLNGDVTDGIERAAELAAQALRLLDDLPGGVMEKAHAFAQNTGIEGLVEDLRALGPRETLEGSVRLRLRRVAERLVGKIWDEIGEEDLEKVRAWAENARDYLSLADFDDPDSRAHRLKARMQGYLRRAKVDFGLTLSFEIERLIRESALIDFEIDPDGPPELLAEVSDALRRGRVRPLLNALFDHAERSADDEDDDRDEPESSFHLRECLFLSEKIRTTAFSSVFRLVGLGRDDTLSQSDFSRRVEQASLRVRGGSREGSWSGGYLRGDVTPELAAVSGAWLQCTDTDDHGDVRRPFGGRRDASLRLVATFEDATAQAQELQAFDFLLRDLGLLAELDEDSDGRLDRGPSELVPEGVPLRLSVEVRFPLRPGSDDDPLRRVLALADDRRWDLAVLHAAHRRFHESFVTGGPRVRGRWSFGRVLREALEHRFYIEHGHAAGRLKAELAGLHGELSVRVGQGLVPIRIDPPGPLGGMLLGVTRKRAQISKRVRALEAGWTRAVDERTEDAYRDLARAFARHMRRASLHGKSWPNPMFVFWLWIAAITEMAPDALVGARGFAALRWQEPQTLDDGELEEPRWETRVYTTEEVPDNRPLTGRDVFVIRH